MQRILPLFIAVALAAFTPGRSSDAVRSVAPLTAFTRPHRLIQLASPIDGILADVRVERGDSIAKGQVLAELELSAQRAYAEITRVKASHHTSMRLAEAQLALDAKRLEQRESLFDQGVLSEEALIEARTTKHMSELALIEKREENRLAVLEAERAMILLEQGTIRSPIDGVVVERLLSPGELVRRSTDSAILCIAQLDPLRIEVTAPVALFPLVKKGTVVHVEFLEPVGQTRDATVTGVDRVFDAASSTFQFQIELDNPRNSIPAGLLCQVQIDSERRDVKRKTR